MIVALRIGLALVSTACLLATTAYFVMAIAARSDTLYLLGRDGVLSFGQKVFAALSGIGLLVCMFSGANAMLFWLPASWGSVDQDGVFIPLRSVVASLITMVGIGWLQIVAQADFKAKFLNVIQAEAAELRSLVGAAGDSGRLRMLRDKYAERLAELAEQSGQKRSFEATPLAVDEGISAQRRLLEAVDSLMRVSDRH